MTTDETVSLLTGGYRVTAGNFDSDRIYDIASIDNQNKIHLIKKSENGMTFVLGTGYNFPVDKFDNLSAYDIDGDGIDEVIYRNRNDGTYFSLKISSTGISSPSTIFYSQANGLIWGDFDGDGIVEPVAFRSGDNFISFRHFAGTSSTVATLQNSYDYCYAGDFNGDGKSDLIFLFGLKSHIYTYNIKSCAWELMETDGFPNAYQYLAVGDFNGDGMSDLLFLPNNESQWKMAVRRGENSWTLQIVPELDGSHYTTNSERPKYPPIVCDIDGDGKSDIIQPVANNTIKYILSKGCYNDVFQYSETGTFAHTNAQAFLQGHYSMGDFDGNGIVDILFSNPNSGEQVGSIKYFHKDSFPGYFVSQITDNVGKKLKLEYRQYHLCPLAILGRV